MKKRLLFSCLVIAMLLSCAPGAFAGTLSMRASGLSDPIIERLLEGENKYQPPFDFLNNSSDVVGITVSEDIKELLVRNSRTDVTAEEIETAQRNLTEDKQDELKTLANKNKVIKVEFETHALGAVVKPAFKWLVIGAPYGTLPTPEELEEKELQSLDFVGWFTVENGGDLITPDSLTAYTFQKLHAHWNLKFTDVKENSAFYSSILWAVQNRITRGNTAEQFSPELRCVHKQILMFLWRVATQPSNAETNNFEAALEWAYQQGLLSREDANFDQNAFCTRAEAMVYLWKQCGQPQPSAEEVSATLDTFKDISADSAYASAVAWAVKNGVTKGTSDTTFSPDNTCTRGQIITFLYRAYKSNLLGIGKN